MTQEEEQQSTTCGFGSIFCDPYAGANQSRQTSNAFKFKTNKNAFVTEDEIEIAATASLDEDHDTLSSGSASGSADNVTSAGSDTNAVVEGQVLPRSIGVDLDLVDAHKPQLVCPVPEEKNSKKSNNSKAGAVLVLLLLLLLGIASGFANIQQQRLQASTSPSMLGEDQLQQALKDDLARVRVFPPTRVRWASLSKTMNPMERTRKRRGRRLGHALKPVLTQVNRKVQGWLEKGQQWKQDHPVKLSWKKLVQGVKKKAAKQEEN